MKRATLIYVTSYLAVGGLAMLIAPELGLQLLLSNGDYGDVMPRMVGMFMLVLATLVGAFVLRRDYTYYPVTIAVRVFIVAVLAVLFVRSNDPLFLVLEGIVLVGLLPSLYAQWRGRP